MLTSSELAPGLPYPLGATPRGGGVNFAVFSAHATAIEVCIFDAAGKQEITRHRLHASTDHVWYGFMAGAGAGLVYGLRVHGPFAPEQGHRFNPYKLLLDPYAREIVGHFAWRDEHHAYTIGHPDEDRAFDTRDNSPWMVKARVCDPLGPLATPKPCRPLVDTVMYELHVKGFTKLLESVPAPLRGTYAGLGHPSAIEHMQRLGITALSVLPV